MASLLRLVGLDLKLGKCPLENSTYSGISLVSWLEWEGKTVKDIYMRQDVWTNNKGGSDLRDRTGQGTGNTDKNSKDTQKDTHMYATVFPQVDSEWVWVVRLLRCCETCIDLRKTLGRSPEVNACLRGCVGMYMSEWEAPPSFCRLYNSLSSGSCLKMARESVIMMCRPWPRFHTFCVFVWRAVRLRYRAICLVSYSGSSR